MAHDGMLGLDSIVMESGDVIGVLFGGHVPYILWPTEDDAIYRFMTNATYGQL